MARGATPVDAAVQPVPAGAQRLNERSRSPNRAEVVFIAPAVR